MKKIWPSLMILASGLVLAATASGQAINVSIDASVAPVVTVAGSTTSITGTASGGTGITRVTWQTSNGATGTASGTGKWEASGIPVAQGNTTIVIRAFDSKGSSAWVAMVAVRQPQTVISSAAKLPPPPAL
jgi:hypothetical protein